MKFLVLPGENWAWEFEANSYLIELIKSFASELNIKKNCLITFRC